MMESYTERVWQGTSEVSPPACIYYNIPTSGELYQAMNKTEVI